MTSIQPPSPTRRRIRWPSASLRDYLVVVIVLAIVPLAAFSLYLVQQLAAKARVEADAAVHRSARAFALLVERELSSSIDLLTGLAYNDALQRGDPAALHRRLQDGEPMRPGWRGVYLAELDGTIVFASDQPYGRTLGRLRDLTALERVRTTLQPAVTDMVTVAASGDIVTGVQVPVLVGGRLRYVLGARIAASHWQQLAQRAAVLPDGFISLLDTGARVVAHSLEPEQVGRIRPVDAQVQELAARHERWRRVPWWDLPPLVARQEVAATGWAVGAAVPPGPLVDTQAGALAAVLGAGMLSLLLGLSLALTVARRATRSLHQLAKGGPQAVDEPVVVQEIAALRDALQDAAEQGERARQELQRKADEFEALFSSSPVGLAMTLDVTGTRAHVNPALAAMLGVHAGTQDLRTLFRGGGSDAPAQMRQHGRALRIDEQPMQQAAMRGTPVDADDLELVHRDGRRIDLEVHAVPLLDASGAPRGAVAAFADITARRLVEQQRSQLMRAEQEARRAAEDANRSKDEFLAMLGHELRNPLGAIGAAVEVLNRTQGQGDLARNARRVIERQTRHMAQLMNDLQDATRATTGKLALDPRRVELSRVALRAVEALRMAGRFRHQRLTIDVEPAWAEVDPMRMEQVIGNLLTNAAKYTPAGGSIELVLRRAGDDVVLQVRDSGLGIAPAMLSRVFDLFVQAERAAERRQGGLGLGLALVRRLVELHGGTVDAYSEGYNRGSLFTVRLPATEPPSQADGAAPAQEPAPLHRHVLMVSPPDDVPLTAAGLLAGAGCKVTTVDDVEAALDVIAAAPPDVAFVDLALGQDGARAIAEGVRRAGAPTRLAAIADGDPAPPPGYLATVPRAPTLPGLMHVLRDLPRGALAA